MSKRPEIVLGFLLATALWAVAELFQSAGWRIAPWPEILPWLEKESNAITALATAVMAYFTFTIYRNNRSQLQHSREVDRAYVSGGGTRQLVQYSGNGSTFLVPTDQFDVRINNFGNTPATLHRFRFGFCDATAVPLRPPYGAFVPLTDSIGPGMRAQHVYYVPIPKLGYPRVAICGRFYWDDIWGNHWSSGFIYEIPAPNTDTNDALSVEAPTAYREERRE
jgi:hypothetical protein